MIVSRRGLIKGLFAAPAIIAAERLMPVRLWKPDDFVLQFADCITWYADSPGFVLQGPHSFDPATGIYRIGVLMRERSA
jgi:hypothetical protein